MKIIDCDICGRYHIDKFDDEEFFREVFRTNRFSIFHNSNSPELHIFDQKKVKYVIIVPYFDCSSYSSDRLEQKILKYLLFS